MQEENGGGGYRFKGKKEKEKKEKRKKKSITLYRVYQMEFDHIYIFFLCSRRVQLLCRNAETLLHFLCDILGLLLIRTL